MSLPPPLPGASSAPSLPRRTSWGRVILITAACVLGFCGLAAASGMWWYEHNFHASPFHPVQLSQKEQAALDRKMAELKTGGAPASDPSKTIVLSEREINGYLKEQGLGEQIKVKLDRGSISATALVPLDKDVPVLGGHTVRLKLSLNTELDRDHRLALRVGDVNVSGVSLPNAWLGNIKGVNLLDDTANSPMKDFADGIKTLDIKDGEIRVVLND